MNGMTQSMNRDDKQLANNTVIYLIDSLLQYWLVAEANLII